MFPVIILILFCVIFAVEENKEPVKLQKLLSLENNIGMAEQDLMFIKLYSLHYAISDPALDGFESVGNNLNRFIYEMFNALQIMMTSVTEGI